MILLGVGNPNILLGSLNELLPQLLLEFGDRSVNLHIFQKSVEFELVELLFLELLEGILDGHFGC